MSSSELLTFDVPLGSYFQRQFQHIIWYFYCSVKSEISADLEENPSDEVIEERLIHSLSREYIEMLGK